MPVSNRIKFRLLEMLIFALYIFSNRERIIIISKELLLFNNYYFKQVKVLFQNTDTMFCKNYPICINPTPERSDETAHDFSTHRKDFFFLFMCLVTQSCPTLCNPMDCIVHGILQARILECVSFPFSRGSSQSMDRTQVSGRFFTIEPLHNMGISFLFSFA